MSTTYVSALTIMFVSVNQTVGPLLRDGTTAATIDQAAEGARGNWANITPARAASADVVVAVAFGRPVAAWRLIGAYAHPTETYGPHGTPRVALDLGEPIIVPSIAQVPPLRNGCAVADVVQTTKVE